MQSTSESAHDTTITTNVQTRSLRALRKLLVAFRCAARMNEDEENTSSGGWKIEEASGAYLTPIIVFEHSSFTH